MIFYFIYLFIDILLIVYSLKIPFNTIRKVLGVKQIKNKEERYRSHTLASESIFKVQALNRLV